MPPTCNTMYSLQKLRLRWNVNSSQFYGPVACSNQTQRLQLVARRTAETENNATLPS